MRTRLTPSGWMRDSTTAQSAGVVAVSPVSIALRRSGMRSAPLANHAKHIFRRFLLYDMCSLSHATVKVFTDQKWRPGDYWYEGWQCRCSEQGYAA